MNGKFDGQHSHFRVNNTVQPYESVLIAVDLCMPETGPQNGVGWLLPKVTDLPTYLLTWIHYIYARVIGGKI